jgi:hypothetical protein
MEGIILCKTNVAFKPGSSLNGRIFAQTHVALEMATINQPKEVTNIIELTAVVPCVIQAYTCNAQGERNGDDPITQSQAIIFCIETTSPYFKIEDIKTLNFTQAQDSYGTFLTLNVITEYAVNSLTTKEFAPDATDKNKWLITSRLLSSFFVTGNAMKVQGVIRTSRRSIEYVVESTGEVNANLRSLQSEEVGPETGFVLEFDIVQAGASGASLARVINNALVLVILCALSALAYVSKMEAGARARLNL